MNVQPKQMYTAGSKFTCGGNCFVVPGGTSWNLSDLKITGSDYEADYIQCIQSTGALVDRAKSYYYDDDYSDWCYLFADSGKKGKPVDDADRVLPAGTAFLVVFNSKNAKLTYSGEVQAGESGKIKLPRAAKFQFFANQLPYDVNVCDLAIEGGDYEADYIQFIQTSYALVDRVKSFYFDDDNKGMSYLFADSGKKGKLVKREDGMVLKAGEGVMAVFNSKNAKLVFTAPSL